MITKEFLEKWVDVIVPKELGPDRNPTSDKPILGVYVSSEEDMNSAQSIFKIPLKENQRVFGVVVPIGELRRLAIGNAGKLEGKYIIRIHESQSEPSAVFTLAHEVGHVVGIVNNDSEHDADEDAYADSYAFSRIKEVVKDPEFRSKIYMRGFIQGDFETEI